MPGVDRNILRIGCFELVFIEETPSAVIVNEAVELSKHFGTDQSSKFVNGVLAGVLRNLPDLRLNAKGQTPQ
jgi:N utilization substance protein B